MLGLYPINSSAEEREVIREKSLADYTKALEAWQKVEQTKKEIEKEVSLTNGHRSDSVGDLGSPSLSTISGSPSSSPSTEASRNGTPEPPLSSNCSPSHKAMQDVSENGLPAKGDGGKHLHKVVPAVTVNGTTVGGHTVLLQDEDDDQRRRDPVQKDSSHLSTSYFTCESHDRSHDESCDDSSLECTSEGADTGGGGSTPTHLFSHNPEEVVTSSLKLDAMAKLFVKEMYNIDKDIPRCDRDYWWVGSLVAMVWALFLCVCHSSSYVLERVEGKRGREEICCNLASDARDVQLHSRTRTSSS